LRDSRRGENRHVSSKDAARPGPPLKVTDVGSEPNAEGSPETGRVASRPRRMAAETPVFPAVQRGGTLESAGPTRPRSLPLLTRYVSHSPPPVRRREEAVFRRLRRNFHGRTRTRGGCTPSDVERRISLSQVMPSRSAWPCLWRSRPLILVQCVMWRKRLKENHDASSLLPCSFTC
jgi:hypothetical protein